MPANRELISPEVETFVARHLSNHYAELDYERVKEAIASNYKIALAADLRLLFMLSLIEDYSHPNPLIEKEIREGFNAMRGSWKLKQLQMLQFVIYGFSFSEFGFVIKNKKARIKAIHILNQEKIRFVLSNGQIENIEYSSDKGSLQIPYSYGIHLTHQDYLMPGSNPKGLSSAMRALNYIDLHKIVMSAMAIAAQRQATPIIALKTDTESSQQLVDSSGNPILDNEGNVIFINKAEAAGESLEELENNSYIVINRLDEIEAIAQQTDGHFFRRVLAYLDQAIMWSFLVSPIIAGQNESGVGDASLIEGHLDILKIVARSQMRVFASSLIEQIVKPIIMFNYGEIDSYGDFPIPEEDKTDTLELLKAIGNVASSGIFSTEDLSIIKRAKELAGIEE